MALALVPMTITAAKAFVLQHHRHNKPPVSALFALGAEHEGVIVGVAMVGRPVARGLQDGFTAEVTRLCVLDSAPKGTCSFLYARCDRAAKALGYRRVLTYTLERESGASLRGAGWLPFAAVKGREWSRPSRPRATQAVYAENKIRWHSKGASNV